MTDLQLALITLGALIIAGVVVYNWMQERKMRKNITDEFLVPQKDVLAEDFYIDADAYVDKALEDVSIKAKLQEKLNETALEAEMEAPESENVFVALDEIADEPMSGNAHEIAGLPLDEPVSAPSVPTQIEKAARTPAVLNADAVEDATSPLPNEIHPQIDLTAFLYATKSISTQTLNTMANAIADDMGVPMMVHGYDKSGKWHLVNANTAEESYKQIACSIQLADRGGPISKHVLNKFQFAVENMGLELGAHVEWQGAGEALQRAVELDKFCMEVDQLISVHLVEIDTPIHGTKFKGLAEANGLTLLEDGKFHCFIEHSAEVISYTLSSSDGQPFATDGLRNSVIKGAVFQIEIPKVTNSEQVFNQVIAIAKKMAASLNAQLVDDNKKPLGDLQIEKIRQQLKVIHATMVARSIMPGSPNSARLFN